MPHVIIRKSSMNRQPQKNKQSPLIPLEVGLCHEYQRIMLGNHKFIEKKKWAKIKSCSFIFKSNLDWV